MNIALTRFKRIILTSHPINFLINKSKKWILPGFEGVPIYEVIRFFKKQLSVHGLTERASAISFNFIMSIPPTCLFYLRLYPISLSFQKKAFKYNCTI